MKLKNFQGFSEFLLLTVLLTFTACGGATPGDNSLSSNDSGESATSGTATSGTDASGSSTQTLEGLITLNLDSDNEAVVQFNDIDTNNNYVLALYSYDTSSASYNLSVTSPDVSSSLVTTSALESASSDDEDVTEEAHESLRNMEAGLMGDIVEVPSTRMKAASTPLTVGSQRTFKVLQSFSSSTSYQTVTAQLQYISDNFYVYIDTRNLADVNSDKINTVLNNFDAVVSSERELFGHESDVNGDGRFAILLTQAVNELGAMQGGIVSGFYFGGDLYSASSSVSSNEMEILYSLVPDPPGAHGTKVSESFACSNLLPSVFPHEFQHMISYNQHVLINDGSSEASFLGEGMSHLAEDIYSRDSNGYMISTGVENPSRINLYLDDTASVCFLCGANIYQRGASYLMTRYLYEQAEKGNLTGASNGADLIHRLLDTDLTGMDNLLYAATGSSDDNGFGSLMASFGATLYLSNSGLSDNNHYNFDGINLRAKQNDNRSTNLEGPAVVNVSSLPYNVTLVSAGISYLQVSGEQLADLNGLLTIQFPSGMKGGGVIIQLN